jgi:hypothetical protein
MHQTVFDVLSQFGYQVDSINKELLEEGFRNVPFIIDDEVKLKTEEPSNAAMALCCQSPQYFMEMLSLYVAGS